MPAQPIPFPVDALDCPEARLLWATYQKEGTIWGVARALGIHRSTAQRAWARYRLPHPRKGPPSVLARLARQAKS